MSIAEAVSPVYQITEGNACDIPRSMIGIADQITPIMSNSLHSISTVLGCCFTVILNFMVLKLCC